MKASTVTISSAVIALICASAIVTTPAPSEAKAVLNSGNFQSGSGWALASALGENNINSKNYWYPKTAGNGATVYIVDSGVSNNADIFEGEVTAGYNVLNGDVNGSANTDCTGHGTTVASIVSGKNTGVAKNAKIIPVKVGECDKAYNPENIVLGLNWIKNNKPAEGVTGIVNLSFGFLNNARYSDRGIEQAVQDLTNEGFFVTIAAGNNSSENDIYNSCDVTPARVSNAFTVGSYSVSDDGKFHRSDFSESGSCIDIWAPGDEVNIESVSTGNFVSSYVSSGTSISAPYVAGLAALLIGENKKYSSHDLEEIIKEYGLKGKLEDSPEHPLNSSVSYHSDATQGVSAQSITSETVNLIAQLPFEAPEIPKEVKNLNINRALGNAHITWEADSSVIDSSKISYAVSYVKTDDGYIKSEGTKIVTTSTNLTLHGLENAEYAYKIETINDGRVGESTGWISVPAFYVCFFSICIV